MITCPECGEETSARWVRLRDVPGCRPAFLLRHRRAGGGRCAAIRGERLDGSDDPNICTGAAQGAILATASRSERARERATAR